MERIIIWVRKKLLDKANKYFLNSIYTHRKAKEREER